ncbi:hypothetical protein, partial [Actinomadura darangshiensis]|uniref:hypothetical protein n=1 Tax=Actinomadura darangshiensis TaxID=705336 RepID=UPI001A9F4FBD
MDVAVNSVRYLDELGAALGRKGWSASLRFGRPPLLRVVHPSLRGVGESVAVVLVEGVPWFRASTGDLIGPCSDVRGARARIVRTLGPLVAG